MFLRSQLLKSPHGFSTRQGGVSTLPHTSSLNLAFGRGDEDTTVLENLRLFAAEMGIEEKSILSFPQIHSDKIYKVGKDDCGKGYFFRENIPEGDGYVTNASGVALGIKTADCAPILLEGVREGKVIAVGAVHAGWRGTVAGIAAKCVALLCREFSLLPEEIRAVIGPCIHSCCYEVGEELLEAARDCEKVNGLYSQASCKGLAESCFTSLSWEGKYAFDLPRYNRELLIAAGILEENIETAEHCTCCHPELFFSHRYSKGIRGTMLSVISMP